MRDNAVILNRQRSVAVSLPSLERFWQRMRRSFRLPKDSLTICLVSEAQIARWNCRYRGKRGPTDVLSFPAAIGWHGPKRRGGKSRNGSGRRTEASHDSSRATGIEAQNYLGDIAIAPAVARHNALRLGRRIEQELRILILHGVLHLVGYDHETDGGQMERLERRLRRRLGLGET